MTGYAELASASIRLLIVGFIAFAFWQGEKVKPDKDNADRWDSFGGPPESHHGP
jgi:hypothetical protein